MNRLLGSAATLAALLVEAPAWYVLARDAATGAARLFRMDRVRGARPVPERAFVPDFDAVCREAFGAPS